VGSWENGLMSGAIFGLVGTLLGMLLTLYIKEKAREIAKAELSETVKTALALFKVDLFDYLDRTYLRSPEIKLVDEHIQDRLDIVEQAIRNLEKIVYSKEK
jgi:ABC-type lipoprotein release transport system permease subunit